MSKKKKETKLDVRRCARCDCAVSLTIPIEINSIKNTRKKIAYIECLNENPKINCGLIGPWELTPKKAVETWNEIQDLISAGKLASPVEKWVCEAGRILRNDKKFHAAFEAAIRRNKLKRPD